MARKIKKQISELSLKVNLRMEIRRNNKKRILSFFFRYLFIIVYITIHKIASQQL